jgi:hypothetical protein
VRENGAGSGAGLLLWSEVYINPAPIWQDNPEAGFLEFPSRVEWRSSTCHTKWLILSGFYL